MYGTNDYAALPARSVYLASVVTAALIASPAAAEELTEEALCAEHTELGGKILALQSSCGVFEQADQLDVSEADCAEAWRSLSCGDEVKLWYRRYLRRMAACLQTIPACSADNRDVWVQEHLGPCFNEAIQAARPPENPDCRWQDAVLGPTGQGSPESLGDWDLSGQSGTSPSSPASPEPVSEPLDGTFVTRKDGGAPPRAAQVSVLGLFGGAYSSGSLGVAGLFGFPVLKTTGLLNDALYLEGGAMLNFVFFSGGSASFLTLVGGVRYEIFITEPFSLYVAARTGPDFAFSTNLYGFGWRVTSHLGGHYRFSDSLALRLELLGGNRSYYGAAAGVTFSF